VSVQASSYSFTGIGVLIFILLLFIFHIISCTWAYRDALSKGRSYEYALLTLIVILLLPVVGLIICLLIRNDAGTSDQSRY